MKYFCSQRRSAYWRSCWASATRRAIQQSAMALSASGRVLSFRIDFTTGRLGSCGDPGTRGLHPREVGRESLEPAAPTCHRLPARLQVGSAKSIDCTRAVGGQHRASYQYVRSAKRVCRPPFGFRLVGRRHRHSEGAPATDALCPLAKPLRS